MHWQFTPYVLPVIASAIVSAAVAFFLWRRRPAPGATLLSLLMLAVAEWSLAYAVELVSTDLPTILFWDNISWLGSAFAPTLWLIFALQYTGRTKCLTHRIMAILMIEPLVTLLLVGTNQFHGLIEGNIKLDTSGSFVRLEMTYGVWYWINIAYSYLLLFIGAILICLLMQSLIRSSHLYLGQASAVLLAVLAPWVGNALTIFGLSPFPMLDLTPFAFTISGLAIGWSLFRFRLFDIIPIARAAVIENMRDAVIVLDVQDRIVDLNPAAQRLAARTASRAVGRPFTQIFACWLELAECCRDETEADTEITIGDGEALRYFDLHISPLYRRNGHLAVAGRLIVLNDITERKQAEKALRESKAGAAGYVLKDISQRELINSIQDFLRGESMLNKELVIRLLRQLTTETPHQEVVLPERLSPREREVLQLLAQGQTNREIAQHLTVSLSTVKIHVEHILAKLGVSDRTQAAVRAIELGLLQNSS